MLLSCHQNTWQNCDINIKNRFFENVAQLKYFGRTVTSQNLKENEIKRKLNFGNTCYHSVQNFCLCVLPKNVKIRICKTLILPVVLYERKTCSLTLRE
jgi:hypothetical protein